MNEELIHLHVSEILIETSGTRHITAKTLVLQPVDNRPVRYRAGQFLTFVLHISGHEVRRSYSLSSTPGVDADLRITIKRVDNGEVSRYLLDHVQVGDVLTSLPPLGRFVLETSPGTPRDIVLMGAGSGITPLFSILKQVLHEEPDSRVTLLYSNTSEHSVVFRDSLNALRQRHADRFRLIHLLSQPTGDGGLNGEVRRGRLNNLLLELMLPGLTTFDRADARWYICGPGDYMRMVQFTLLFLGIKQEQIRKENFTVDVVSVPAISPERARDHRIALTFRGTEYTLQVPAYQSILEAALGQGIPLPYSCRGGRCSACAVRCRRGRVAMTINDVLTENDLANGWVLTCTGYPESDDVQLFLEEIPDT
ncbi:ferredoxin--NADP reductase [Tellurirhabdus rosea]|uniref:ferredoxin--NADP reductase n=1 Tax=Tellurirhabdus rosea TaxID=2674997 RepID=UPI00225BEF5B|nr:ferredoxin--NADP reductase [Tellurirhabdus rosea]